MSWQKELDELRRRQALAREKGGPDKLARQRAQRKLNLRERVVILADGGSFRELGSCARSKNAALMPTKGTLALRA